MSIRLIDPEAPPKKYNQQTYNREYYQKNKVQCRANMDQYRLDNVDKLKEKSREWRESHKVYRREYELKTKYGISIEDYNALLVAQGNKCAICKQPSSKTFHIDHCHETGEVRGALCHKCNTAIGSLDDSVKLLQSAIIYLTSHKRSK